MILSSVSRKLLLARANDSSQIISELGFQIVVWICLGLCITSFALRASIRLLCFRRLLLEDYLMAASLCILTGVAAMLHVFLPDVYYLVAVQQGTQLADLGSLPRLEVAIHADGAAMLTTIIGLWLIKLNFLLFFYRLVRQIRVYVIFWWLALAVMLASFAAAVALVPYRCLYSDLTYVISECSQTSVIEFVYSEYKAGVAVDVLTDVLIIAFPIFILWRSKINLRQKLILSAVFSLGLFVIAVTIVRGSSIGDKFYQSVEQARDNIFDLTWMLFWHYIEYIVSFQIACLVSFRSLWTNRERKAQDERYELEKQQRAASGPLRSPGHTFGSPNISRRTGRSGTTLVKLYDSLMDTCADLEGTKMGGDGHGADQPPEYIELEPARSNGGITRTLNFTVEERSGGIISRRSGAVFEHMEPATSTMCYYEGGERMQKISSRPSPSSSMRRAEEGEERSGEDEQRDSFQLLRPQAAHHVNPKTTDL